MGEAKQLLPVAGVPMVRHAVNAALAARCARVRVVVGAYAPEVREALAGTDLEIVENPDWMQGLSTSIAAGLAATLAAGAPAGLLLLLADQPKLTAAVLDALIDAFEGRADSLAACAYAGGLGAPAIFGPAYFQALSQLEGDRGARALLDRYSGRVRAVPWEDGVVDLDTPADYGAYSK